MDWIGLSPPRAWQARPLLRLFESEEGVQGWRGRDRSALRVVRPRPVVGRGLTERHLRASEADAQACDGAVVLLAAGDVGIIGAEGLDAAADADVQSHAEEGRVLAPLRAGDGKAAAAGNEGEVGVTAGAVQPVLPRQGGEGPQAQALLEREGLADLDPQGGVERGVAILPDVQVGVARPRLAVALGAAVQEAQPGEGLEGEGLELEAMAHLGEGLGRPAVVVGLGLAIARGQADGALALEVVPGEAGAAAQAPVAAAPEARSEERRVGKE